MYESSPEFTSNTKSTCILFFYLLMYSMYVSCLFIVNHGFAGCVLSSLPWRQIYCRSFGRHEAARVDASEDNVALHRFYGRTNSSIGCISFFRLTASENAGFESNECNLLVLRILDKHWALHFIKNKWK